MTIPLSISPHNLVNNHMSIQTGLIFFEILILKILTKRWLFIFLHVIKYYLAFGTRNVASVKCLSDAAFRNITLATEKSHIWHL